MIHPFALGALSLLSAGISAALAHMCMTRARYQWFLMGRAFVVAAVMAIWFAVLGLYQ
jgi:hypothetical protein